jgi:hypothetical protein
MKLINPLFMLSLLFLSSAFNLSMGQEAATFLETPYKNQKNSVTKWGEINLNKFLSLKDWKEKSDERNLNPEWESVEESATIEKLSDDFFNVWGSVEWIEVKAFLILVLELPSMKVMKF